MNFCGLSNRILKRFWHGHWRRGPFSFPRVFLHCVNVLFGFLNLPHYTLIASDIHIKSQQSEIIGVLSNLAIWRLVINKRRLLLLLLEILKVVVEIIDSDWAVQNIFKLVNSLLIWRDQNQLFLTISIFNTLNSWNSNYWNRPQSKENKISPSQII